MNRWKASGIHLSICALIALAVISVMLFVWYPDPYFQSLGGKKLIMIIIGVDVVLGPLLTCIIYKPNKKGLKFDLSVIATIQLVALAYGVNVLFQERPVYVVFVKDRFEIVSASDVDRESLAKSAIEKYKTMPLTGPELAVALTPKDPKEREKILFSSIDKGKDIQSFPEHFVQYQEQTGRVLKRSQPLSRLRESKPESAPLIEAFLDRNHLTESELSYLPMHTQRGEAFTAVLDASDAKILDIFLFDPWVEGS